MERSHYQIGQNAIEYIDHMVDNHQNYCNPADIVQIMFFHKFPTFANFLYNIIAKQNLGSYQHISERTPLKSKKSAQIFPKFSKRRICFINFDKSDG